LSTSVPNSPNPGELFIVDNDDSTWTGLNYLREWTEIAEVIRSTMDTARSVVNPPASLRDLRLKIEKHIRNTYLKQVQAPVGVKPVLKCWMELN
jgi:hypothetical protein